MAANIISFDTSEYPATNPLHSLKNAKTLRWFQDECISFQSPKFFWLRCKMYSMKHPNGRIKITAKAAWWSQIEKNLKHKDYLHTLHITNSSYATFRTITSLNHAGKTQVVSKYAYRHLMTSDTCHLTVCLLLHMDIFKNPAWTTIRKKRLLW